MGRVAELLFARNQLTSRINAAFTKEEQKVSYLAYVKEKQPRAVQNMRIKWLQQAHNDALKGVKDVRMSRLHNNGK